MKIQMRLLKIFIAVWILMLLGTGSVLTAGKKDFKRSGHAELDAIRRSIHSQETSLLVLGLYMISVICS